MYRFPFGYLRRCSEAFAKNGNSFFVFSKTRSWTRTNCQEQHVEDDHVTSNWIKLVDDNRRFNNQLRVAASIAYALLFLYLSSRSFLCQKIYDKMPGTIHTSIKAIMGSMVPERAIPEYTTAARSKNKPAYAHSLAVFNPGSKITIDPISLAQPVNGIK